jgi:hypothetical protein
MARELFACEIFGPKDLSEHGTGTARFGANGNPYLKLFHQTTIAARAAIEAGKNFRTGPCNIQGTTKRLTNIAYAYFTPLDAVKFDSDLHCIAMASDGKIYLRRDGAPIPKLLPPDWASLFKDDVLVLDVYPGDLKKREESIGIWIDSACLAPQHINAHFERIAYYEIALPFVHRIGTDPKGIVPFDVELTVHSFAGLRVLEYAVVGDCTTLEGLAAPYDEENTQHILKIEMDLKGRTIHEFWFDYQNSDHFLPKNPELQKFEVST